MKPPSLSFLSFLPRRERPLLAEKTLSTHATNPAMFVTFHPKHMSPDYNPNVSLYLTMREIEMLPLGSKDYFNIK